jgi:hypothetical protein
MPVIQEVETSATTPLQKNGWIPPLMVDRRFVVETTSDLEAPLILTEQPLVQQKPLSEIEKPKPDTERQALLRNWTVKDVLTDTTYPGIRDMLDWVIPSEKEEIPRKRRELARVVGGLMTDLVTIPIADKERGGIGNYLPSNLTPEERNQMEGVIVEALSVAEDDHLLPRDSEHFPYKVRLNTHALDLAKFLHFLYAQTTPELQHESGPSSLWGTITLTPDQEERLLTGLKSLKKAETIRDAILSLPLSVSERMKIEANLPPGSLDVSSGDGQISQKQRRGLLSLESMLTEKYGLFKGHHLLLGQKRREKQSGEKPEWYQTYLAGKAMALLLKRQEKRLNNTGANEAQLEALRRFQEKVNHLIEEFKVTLQPETGNEGEGADYSLLTLSLNTTNLSILGSQLLGMQDEHSITEITKLASMAFPSGCYDKGFVAQTDELGRVIPYVVRREFSVSPYILRRKNPAELAVIVLSRLQNMTVGVLLSREQGISLDNTPEATRRVLSIAGGTLDPAIYEEAIKEKLIASMQAGENETGSSPPKAIPWSIVIQEGLRIARMQGAFEPYENIYSPDPESAALATGLAAQSLAILKSIPGSRREGENMYASLLSKSASLRELAFIAATAHTNREANISLLESLGEEHFLSAQEALEIQTAPPFETLDRRFAVRFPDERIREVVLKFLCTAQGNIQETCGLRQLDRIRRREMAPMIILSGGSGVGKSTMLRILWLELVPDGIVVTFGAGAVTKSGYQTAGGYITDVYKYLWHATRQALEERTGTAPSPERVRQFLESGKVLGLVDEFDKVAVTGPDEEGQDKFAPPGEGVQHEMLDKISEGGTFKIVYTDASTSQKKEQIISTPFIPLAFAGTWETSERAMRAEEEREKIQNGEEKPERKELTGWVKIPANPAEQKRVLRLTAQWLGRMTHFGTFRPVTSEMNRQVLNTPYRLDDPDCNPLNPLARAMAKFTGIQEKRGDFRSVIFDPKAIREIDNSSKPSLPEIGWRASHAVGTALVDHFIYSLNIEKEDKERRQGLMTNRKGELVITKRFVEKAVRARLRSVG